MSGARSLDDLTPEIVEWHDREWPTPSGDAAGIERVAMKLAEETGELLGALLKHAEGRTDKEWLAEARKEFGDVMICLAVLSDRMAGEWSAPPTPEVMLSARWADVSRRRGADYRDRPGTFEEAVLAVVDDESMMLKYPGGISGREILAETYTRWGNPFPLCTAIDVADVMGRR